MRLSAITICLVWARFSLTDAFYSPSVVQRGIPCRASPDEHTIEVVYEGRSTTLGVREGESILAAAERQGVSDRLGLTELPSECRRGNCLTCGAIIRKHGRSLITAEDGLSPTLSRHLRESGYVLTCSTYVCGDGASLELGKNQQIWKDIYRQRLESEATQAVVRAAVAKTMRQCAERNVEEWARETEQVLRKTSNLES